jgi:hypothetical protein
MSTAPGTPDRLLERRSAMTEERRGKERHTSFRMVGLIARDRAGNQREIPIMLRDISGNGIGGVYVGEDPLQMEDEFFLKEADETVKPVRIMWTKKIADYVTMLGLELGAD